jgi:hypothetical protein
MEYETLIEQILDAMGEPVSSKLKKEQPIASTIKAGKISSPNESGFCEHNPAVNKFAKANATQMFIVLAFVFFTMQKQWVFVTNYFEDFVKWLFEIAIPKDDWNWKDKDFSKLPSMYGGGKGEEERLKKEVDKEGNEIIKYNNNIITPEQMKFIRLYKNDDAVYIARLWKNKDKIYDFVMSNLDKPEQIYFYFINEISGLAAVKAAFATQLILGKFGCIDSINQRVYADLISKNTDAFTPEGSVKSSQKGSAKYLDFLKQLEDLYQQDISKTLWDDWCEIVEHKILHANDKGENKQVQIQFTDGTSVNIDPYKIQRGEKVNTSPMIDRARSEIGNKPTGKIVSQQHKDAVMNPAFRKYGISESYKKLSTFNDFVKESCWKNYKQEGMKKKGKKMVPNCVPKKKKKR